MVLQRYANRIEKQNFQTIFSNLRAKNSQIGSENMHFGMHKYTHPIFGQKNTKKLPYFSTQK